MWWHGHGDKAPQWPRQEAPPRGKCMHMASVMCLLNVCVPSRLDFIMHQLDVRVIEVPRLVSREGFEKTTEGPFMCPPYYISMSPMLTSCYICLTHDSVLHRNCRIGLREVHSHRFVTGSRPRAPPGAMMMVAQRPAIAADAASCRLVEHVAVNFTLHQRPPGLGLSGAPGTP